MLQSFFKLSAKAGKGFFNGMQNRPGLTLSAVYIGYESYHEYKRLTENQYANPPHRPVNSTEKTSEPNPIDLETKNFTSPFKP